MTLLEMQTEIADSLNILASDGVTLLASKVTQARIKTRINYVYREVLFDLLSKKKPNNFLAYTQPRGTYTATGIVDATSTGTTLVATTNIFSSNMLGFQIYNFTDSTSATITAYTNASTVTVDSTIGDTWDGDTIYVLGNEFTLSGAASDAKEIRHVWIKYTPTSTKYIPLDYIDKDRNYVPYTGSYLNAAYSFYTTTLSVNGTPTPAVGIYPFFQSYTGSFYLEYIQKPPRLVSDTDEPSLSTQGISDAIINGVTAWGFQQIGQPQRAGEYVEVYDPRGQRLVMPRGTTALVKNYAQNIAGGHYTPSQPNSLRRY